MEQIIELLKTVVLGIVQGITEWLPISSTGHMILVNEFIQLNVSERFWEVFLVVIQLGSILAVVVIYFHKLNPFALTKTKKERKDTWALWFRVLVGVIPAGVIGVLFDDWIEEHFFNAYVVAAALIVYGIAFIVVEKRNEKRIPTVNNFRQMSFLKAFEIGVFQVLSLVPGTSRSGSTILGATILGTSREVAAEFSFFMAIPVMIGASALKLIKFGLGYTAIEVTIMLVGFFMAYIVSYFVIKMLLRYIKKNDFKVFGYYRIGLGVVVLIYGLTIGFSMVGKL